MDPPCKKCAVQVGYGKTNCHLRRDAMRQKARRSALSLNSRWIILSIATILVAAPFAAGSPANASAFSFTQLDVPGATYTFANGINDAGQIVGDAGYRTGAPGFLYTGGSFTQLDLPAGTVAFGI